MSDIRQAGKALVVRILEGDGEASRALRRGAFDNAGLVEPVRTLVQKLTIHADKVTDEDITAAGASGLSQDQIFEIVVCAAVGEATRQYDTALATLRVVAERSGYAPGDPR